jgi:signal peptidase I
LWMPVYDNDFQPVLPQERSFNGHVWQQPFVNEGSSRWKCEKTNGTVFYLDSDAEEVHTIGYDTSIGNELRATYAYDDVREYRYMPYCSDLLVRFCINTTDGQGHVGAELSKYGTRYRAWVDFSGEMVIERMTEGNAPEQLSREQVRPGGADKTMLLKFANVDHQLIFEFGKDKLEYDLGRGPDDTGPRNVNIEPQVKILGSGKLTLSHVAIFRDIHYTASKYANSAASGRAIEGTPFTLAEDEFFVLGDNSPNSEDCRWWSEEGRGNNNRTYRAGMVPRDYLVGKALFVYWPGGFRPFGFRFGIIPNVGEMRLIYGGQR